MRLRFTLIYPLGKQSESELPCVIINSRKDIKSIKIRSIGIDFIVLHIRDESEPEKIEDQDAVKPDGWLDDETELIPDPDAEKPNDWDEDMDGQWEAPKISNPACEEAPGCGEWKRPQIKNPKYKGKWNAPLIDNPDYQVPTCYLVYKFNKYFWGNLYSCEFFCRQENKSCMLPFIGLPNRLTCLVSG